MNARGFAVPHLTPTLKDIFNQLAKVVHICHGLAHPGLLQAPNPAPHLTPAQPHIVHQLAVVVHIGHGLAHPGLLNAPNPAPHLTPAQPHIIHQLAVVVHIGHGLAHLGLPKVQPLAEGAAQSGVHSPVHHHLHQVPFLQSAGTIGMAKA
eukprot:592981-Pelagomonas_calceolata.AAC.1